ncbi:MAG: hypothetical protein PHD43_00145 [Methylococcales bacterium]|jgi:hypothetical protein|nr:hypothetical protein [Methylococcales bacterium]
MLQINEQTESELLTMAHSAGKSANEFIAMLLEIYQEELDVREAEQVLNEEGGIGLNDLKAKYGL